MRQSRIVSCVCVDKQLLISIGRSQSHSLSPRRRCRLQARLLGDLDNVVRLGKELLEAHRIQHAAGIIEDRALVQLVLTAIDETVLVQLGGAGHAQREQDALELRSVRVRVAGLCGNFVVVSMGKE